MTEEEVLNKLSIFKQAIMELKQSKSVLDEQVKCLEAEKTSLMKDLEDTKSILSETSQKVEEYTSQVELLSKENEQYKKDIDSYKDDKNNMESSINSEIDVLKETNESLLKEITLVRQEINNTIEKYKEYKSEEDCNLLIQSAVNNECLKLTTEFETKITDIVKNNNDTEEIYKSTIESLKKELENEKKTNNTLNEKLEAFYKKEHLLKTPPSVPINGSIKYRFGVTTSDVLERVKTFITYLFEDVDPSLKVKELNDPYKIKTKMGLSDKEYEIFTFRLQEITFNGLPIMYADNGKLKTNFDIDWIIKFISEVV